MSTPLAPHVQTFHHITTPATLSHHILTLCAEKGFAGCCKARLAMRAVDLHTRAELVHLVDVRQFAGYKGVVPHFCYLVVQFKPGE